MTPAAIDAFLSAMPIPVVVIDGGGRLFGINGPARALFGKGDMERPYETLIRQPQLIDCIERARSSGAPCVTRWERRERDRPEMFRVQASGVTVAGKAGVLVSFEDITDLHSAERIRRDFVANVSHELKTPLTALLGFIETLQGAARHDPAASERFLGIMASEAQRMNRLVSDLLSLSRVEEDERVRPRTPVNPAALMRTTLSALRPVSAQKQADIQFDEGGLSDLTVPGDGDQLTQVFTNLVENALKYGGGTVRIALSRQPGTPGIPQGAIVVSVHNNGDCIDPIHLPRLTERFYRVDSHRSRVLGGTGLGLAICKHIVNRHRGRLRIESTPDAGSTFSVHLPIS